MLFQKIHLAHVACIASYSADDTENTSGSVTRKATVMSASLLTMQPCSTAMTGNLLSSVDVVNVLLMIYDCCCLIRRVIRLREDSPGMLPGGKGFISPWLPKRQFEGQPDHCRGSRPRSRYTSMPDARRVHDDEHQVLLVKSIIAFNLSNT